MKEVLLTHEPVELYKVLKFEGLASSGGHAKAVIADGQVLVNGVVETRKRKKLVAGDIVEYRQEKIQLTCLKTPDGSPEEPGQDLSSQAQNSGPKS